jgi:protease-4
MSASQPPETTGQPLPPSGYPAYQREGRPVSFYVAIFLGLLLLVSGALNLILLVVSAVGAATGGISGSVTEDDSGRYELVAVGGDRQAAASILRVPIEGAIAEAAIPLMAGGGTVSQVRRALRAAASEGSVKAVLFDIDSPGGGVTDSDEIWRLIRVFREEHPDITVAALMGDLAASGGYYIASACAPILARPTTITGSIGVIISSYNYGEALRKLGIEQVNLISPDTPYKDMLSPTRPMRPDEEAKVLAIVQEMYERFVDVVHEGRPALSREQVKACATGEIFSASRARELGLIDDIASLDEAYEKIAELAGESEMRVLEQRRVPTFFDTLLHGRQQQGLSLDRALASLLRASAGPVFLYYWSGSH